MDIKFIVKSDIFDKHYLSESNGRYCFKVCHTAKEIKVFEDKGEAINAVEKTPGADYWSMRPIILEVVI